MLYGRYADEDEFRRQFVMPLLTRFGLSGVSLTHGQREFGKDFVFAELSRFGFVKYSASQVKHLESITQNQHSVIDGLLAQIKQAFTVSFRVPDSPRDCHVSSVYVFNSGAITDGAREVIRSALIRENFGDNVHVFDGARLSALDQYAAFSADRDLRPRLQGLRTQLQLNIQIWTAIRDKLPEFSDARGSILAALESYLTAPVLSETIRVGDVAEIWQRARILDAICARHRAITLRADDIKARDAELAQGVLDLLLPKARELIEACDRALSQLVPLGSLTHPPATA